MLQVLHETPSARLGGACDIACLYKLDFALSSTRYTSFSRILSRFFSLFPYSTLCFLSSFPRKLRSPWNSAGSLGRKFELAKIPPGIFAGYVHAHVHVVHAHAHVHVVT